MVFNFFSIVRPDRFKEFLSEAHKIQTVRFFNDDLADAIIKYYDIETAWVGMREDWGATSDIYYENGKKNEDCKAQFSSCWASPIIIDEKGREFDCFEIMYRDDNDDSRDFKMDY